VAGKVSLDAYLGELWGEMKPICVSLACGLELGKQHRQAEGQECLLSFPAPRFFGGVRS
jgi:hypothetical protein